MHHNIHAWCTVKKAQEIWVQYKGHGRKGIESSSKYGHRKKGHGKKGTGNMGT